KAPRELNWVVGVLLFATILGLAFTGYLLPWDMKALFATRVGLDIAGSVPFIGDWIQTLLAGDDTIIGAQTLTRFFAIHVFRSESSKRVELGCRSVTFRNNPWSCIHRIFITLGYESIVRN